MPKKKQPASAGPPDPADDHDRQLLADVAKHGWHVIRVEQDEEGPAFAYSIGLFRTFGHPEIILFGLPTQLLHQVLNTVGEEIRSGERFEHLDESTEILEGYAVAFRGVEPRHYRDYFGYARWFYRGDRFPALQCVWPDSEHRYPWHPAFSKALSPNQPLLCDEVSWPFHEGKNRATFTTKPVLQEGHPILLVRHGEDGDWQFLCGTTNRPEDGQVVSLGSILERDRTLAELADLPAGWRAYRRAKGAAWRREKAEGR